MGSEKEIAESDKVAVIRVLNVDDAPPILTASYYLAVHIDVALRSDNCERDQVVDGRIEIALFVIIFALVVWKHAQAVEGEFFLDARFKGLTLFKGHAVGFGDHGNDVYYIAKFFENDDVNRLETRKD